MGLTVQAERGDRRLRLLDRPGLSRSPTSPSDPRFDREAAERTGYVPRSIAAVPLLDDEGTIGVLQVLDKRGSQSFSLRDMELLAVFAAQATAAITATRVQRDTARLMSARPGSRSATTR